MQEFIMVPRSLIYNCELGEKRVLAYSSILFSGWGGKNIEELVSYSKFSTRRDTGCIIYQYRHLINQLINNKYLKKGASQLEYIKQQESFGIIYYDEFHKILKAREASINSGQRMNHSHILLLLSHIRLCMIRHPKMPQYYSNLLSRISISIGISVRNISKCLKILEQLEIIHSEELPRYKDSNGHWHSNVKIFVDMKKQGNSFYDWQDAVARGIRCIMASQIE